MFKLEPRPRVSRAWTYGAPVLALALTVAIGVLLFVLLPWLLRHGFGFWPALGLASVATVLAYGLMLLVLRRFPVALLHAAAP